MKKETLTYRMIRIGLFIIIAMSGCTLMAVSPTHQPGTNNLARNTRMHPLLSELPQAGRFSMSYPMISVPYGEEYSFQNKAWLDFIAKHGTDWRIVWDSQTGRPNIIEGKGIPFYAGKGNSLTRDYQELTIRYLEQKIINFISSHNDLLKIDLSRISLNKEASQIFDNGRYVVIQYDYLMNGVIIEGARLFFRFNNGNLIQFGSIDISDRTIPVSPVISDRKAADTVVELFHGRNGEASTIHSVRLAVVPEIPEGQNRSSLYSGIEGQGLTYRLVWSVLFLRGTPLGDYEAWVDAATGHIVFLRSLAKTGHVRGGITMIPGDRRTEMFPYCTVDNNGTKSTNLFGYYSYTSTPSTTASTTIAGQYFNINDYCGTIDLSTTTSPGNLYFGTSTGTDCDTPGFGGAGNTYAARSTFWHNNIIRRMASFYLSNTWLTTNVEIYSNWNVAQFFCNAGWSPLYGTLNFFRSSTTEPCANSGEVAGIMYHEWGHGLDDNDGGPAKVPAGEESSGEAWGDTMDMLIERDACIGNGLYPAFNPDHCLHCPTDCLGVRYVALRFDDDNNPGTPDVPITPLNITNNNGADCDRYSSPQCVTCPTTKWDEEFDVCNVSDYIGVIGYEGHCESLIASGATWDMLENIVAAKGESGRVWMQRLWFQGVPSMGSAYRVASGTQCDTTTVDGCAAANWYTVLLGIDDDDGNVTNGTPNGGRIWDAFNAHGISCGTRPTNYDVCVEPAAPVLYAAGSDSQVGLSWTPVANATGYRVFINEYSTSGTCQQGGWIPYSTIGNFSYYIFSNLYNSLGHGFVVQALNGSEDCVSPLSNCVYAIPTPSALVNLTGIKSIDWDHVLVPSNNTCTDTTCARTATLNANGTSSNINFKVRNNSSEDAGSHNNALYVDDAFTVAFSQTTHAANTTLSTMNFGIDLKGGRHMLKVEIDVYGTLTESNENDNSWIAQVAVYQPYDLDTDTDHLIVRTAPPTRNPEGYLYYSCDGYHFTVNNTTDDQNWWGAVGMLPVANTSNYDIRLHDDYTGSSQGFGSNVKSSGSGANGQVEIIGVNRNNTATASWWAGVIQASNTPYPDNYTIHSDGSSFARAVPSSGTTGNIPANGVVSIEEIHFQAQDLNMGWRITVTPSGGDIAIALIDQAVANFRLSDAITGTTTNNGGNNVAEYFDFTPTASGYYALLIYKPDYSERLNSINYVLDILEAPSNLHPYLPTGWTAEVLPRNTMGCTSGSCLVTATLPGWSGTTYVNSTTINDGINNVNTPFSNSYTLDGILVDTVTFASLPAGSTAVDTNNALTNVVKGGRHSIGLNVDYLNEYTELNETDNTVYHQYVWSPLNLTDGAYYTMTAPPDRDSGGATAYNCDGYQFICSKEWSITSIVPNGTSYNYDIRLHSDYTGSTAGFSTVLEWSMAGLGMTDFILLYKDAGLGPWYTGVIQATDSWYPGNYTIAYKDSYPVVFPPGNFGEFIIPVAGIAAVHPITVAVNNTFTVTLDITAGSADLAIAIYNSTKLYHDVLEYIPGGFANTGGPGVDESFTLTLTSGTYAIVVFKADWTAVNTANLTNYYLRITGSGIAETPDNNLVPGIPLTISKSGSTQLRLNWGNSCDYVTGYTHYAIYSGDITNIRQGNYDYKPVLCDSGTDTTELITTPSSSSYFVIVPTNNLNEGGYGFTSSGANRPASTSLCYPQNRVPCP